MFAKTFPTNEVIAAEYTELLLGLLRETGIAFQIELLCQIHLIHCSHCDLLIFFLIRLMREHAQPNSSVFEVSILQIMVDRWI